MYPFRLATLLCKVITRASCWLPSLSQPRLRFLPGCPEPWRMGQPRPHSAFRNCTPPCVPVSLLAEVLSSHSPSEHVGGEPFFPNFQNICKLQRHFITKANTSGKREECCCYFSWSSLHLKIYSEKLARVHVCVCVQFYEFLYTCISTRASYCGSVVKKPPASARFEFNLV